MRKPSAGVLTSFAFLFGIGVAKCSAAMHTAPVQQMTTDEGVELQCTQHGNGFCCTIPPPDASPPDVPPIAP